MTESKKNYLTFIFPRTLSSFKSHFHEYQTRIRKYMTRKRVAIETFNYSDIFSNYTNRKIVTEFLIAR